MYIASMISREEIEHLATLARIELREGEVESLQKDISDILEYVGQLRRYNVGAPTEASGVGVPIVPAHHNVLRTDTLRADNDQLAGKEEAVRAAFPKSENGYNVMRKIIQKDEL